MRYREFNLTEDELFELKMSPSNLARMAKDIDARVGMEFELIVPDVEGAEDEYDPEIDWDADESISYGNWRSDITNFFRGGDSPNTTGSINFVLDSIQEEFDSWLDEKWQDVVTSDDDIQQEIIDVIKNDYITQGEDESDEEFDARAKQIANNGEDEFADAANQVREEWAADSYLFEEFMESMDYNTMKDIYDAYSGRLDWPYWYYPESDRSGVSIDYIADDFAQALGVSVNASSSYHGARRDPGKWVVEPDGSLEGDNGESGLEFVSPPMPVNEMLNDIEAVAKWAGRVGAYTNNSTGLHMNVSVPNQQNLDFVKLAIFLGDDYILEQFGREGNTYCKSILKKIKTTASTNPDRVEEMMRQFQGGLNQLASKILHTGSTDKYSSINNRGGWIEFRGPGGDWLGDDLSTVKNTLLRAVVALDVATKPEAFKNEYYKKLYKALNPRGDEDIIQYFAKYAAGELPKAALKSFIKQIQTTRRAGKQATSGTDIPFVWTVYGNPDSPYQSRGTEVVATDEPGARAAAVNKWNLNIGGRSIADFTQGWRAIPMRPASEEEIARAGLERSDTAGVGRRYAYWVHVEGDYERGVMVQAANEYAAKQQATMENPGLFSYLPFADIRAERQPEQSSSQQSDEFTGIWEIVSRATDEVVHRFSGTQMADPRSVAEAEAKARAWKENTGFDDSVYVRPYVRQPGQSSRSVPGSTNDLARQRLAAQMPRHEPFNGNWEVYSIASNNAIYRFAADTEEEAVRAFNIWQDAVRNPSLSREGFNLRAVPLPGSRSAPAAPAAQQEQLYEVNYTVNDGTSTSTYIVHIHAANANAAMDRIRTHVETNSRNRVESIEANPVPPPAWRDQLRNHVAAAQTRGTESLPPGNVRWLILDRNGREIYSFVNTTAQSDANQYALNWITRTAPAEVRQQGPFEVVPAR